METIFYSLPPALHPQKQGGGGIYDKIMIGQISSEEHRTKNTIQ